jgi:chemotaxis protein CheY-P-specific phosphatase CheC
MGNPPKMGLSKIVSDSLEKLAFMFFMTDTFREPIPFQNAVTAEVSFTGGFSGRLAVVMTEHALKELAANMLGIDNEDVEQSHLHDALKEAANIICGNWLPIIGGAEAVFHLDTPRILSPSQAVTALKGRLPSALEKMSADEEPCDIYFFREDG